MDPHPDRKARFSLFVTILTLFLSAALLVGAGVTVSDYVQNRRTAIRVAADTFKEKIGRNQRAALGVLCLAVPDRGAAPR